MNQVIVEVTGEVIMELRGNKVPPFLKNDRVVRKDKPTVWPTYTIRKLEHIEVENANQNQ